MDHDAATTPYRSKELLEGWVKEFIAQGHRVAGHLDVAVQDGSEGRDTGLVIVHLRNELADIYMEPRGIDDPLWEVTLDFGSRKDLTMSPHGLAGLAAELVVAANLCTFLQFKSLDWDRESGRRGH